MVSSRLPLGYRPYRKLFSLADHRCPVLAAPSCPSVGSCSLLAGHFDHRPWSKLFSLAEHDLAILKTPPPSGNRPIIPAHLLATFCLLFTLAWATYLRLICQTRCRSFRVPYSLLFVVFVVVVLDMDRKRKDQLLEALFRASLVEASRLKMKGRPARKAGSASIGNKNKTHKTAVESSRTAFAR